MQQLFEYAVNSGGISMYDFIQRPKEIIDSFASIFRTRSHMLGLHEYSLSTALSAVFKRGFGKGMFILGYCGCLSCFGVKG